MTGEVGELVTIVGSVVEVDGMRRKVSFDCLGATVNLWFLIEEIAPMGFDDEEEVGDGA